MEAAAGLETRPEVVLVDGQGRAHPRRLGIAAHLGLVWDVPTIGCAKSRLTGETRGMPGEARGCRRLLYDRGERVGVLLRTRAGVKPMWISPGHRMDIASAARIVLACTGPYRIPEPVRAAHHLVGNARRQNHCRDRCLRRSQSASPWRSASPRAAGVGNDNDCDSDRDDESRPGVLPVPATGRADRPQFRLTGRRGAGRAGRG
jgi:hypothetical protein